MATLNYNTVEYNVVYIDPTLTESGDGSTPATALITLPNPLVNNTCYIMRRTSEETVIDMPQTKNSGLTHIILLGMPTSESQFYPLISDEVKTAWGSDTYKYANVRMNIASYTSTVANNLCFYENSIKYLVVENCYFFRDANSGSAYQFLGSMFYLGNSGYSQNVMFTNCKFGYSTYNLEDDDYLATNEKPATDTSKYPQAKCSGYVYVNTGENLKFDKCIFNWATYNKYNGESAEYYKQNEIIHIRNGVKEFYLLNSELNRLNLEAVGDYYSANRATGIVTETAKNNYTMKTIIKDFTLNFIFCKNLATQTGVRSVTLNDNYIEVENIKVNFKKMMNYDISSLDVTGTNPIIGLYNVRNILKINNFVCDATKDEELSFSGMPVLIFESSMYPVSSPESYVKNIDVKFPKDPVRILPTSTNVVSLHGTYYGYNSSGGWVQQDNSATQYQNYAKACICDNVNVESYKHKGYALYTSMAGVRSNHIDGKVYISNAVLDVDKINSYYSEGVNINISGNSYLKCNEYKADISRYTGKVNMSVTYPPNSIWINKSNVLLFNDVADTTNTPVARQMVHYCPNYITDGQYIARNPYTFAKSWTVTRTGSNSTASLRFNNNTLSTDPYPLVIGMSPTKGIQLLPSSTGKHQLSCYVALKNFDATELSDCANHLWLEIEVPETLENGTSITHTYTTKGLCWIPDTSTWSGDSDLSTFKITIPVDVKEITNPVNVKISYSLYSVLGFTYLDPDIKLTKI
jgi:hypothetical protein